MTFLILKKQNLKLNNKIKNIEKNWMIQGEL